MKKNVILSLGGSLIVPDEIDVEYLKSFRKLILKYTKLGYKFIICCGGGKTARKYMNASKEIFPNAKDVDMDWVGISATRLNGELLRTLFSDIAKSEVLYFPNIHINQDKSVMIAAGWYPGRSTDFDAVILAETFESERIINLSNIDVVYDKDPRKYKNAKPIKKMSWNAYRKISGSKWSPGLNLPFDPIAAKEAQKHGLEVVVLNGKNLKNFEDCLTGKEFKGTTIR